MRTLPHFGSALSSGKANRKSQKLFPLVKKAENMALVLLVVSQALHTCQQISHQQQSPGLALKKSNCKCMSKPKSYLKDIFNLSIVIIVQTGSRYGAWRHVPNFDLNNLFPGVLMSHSETS